MRAKKLLRTTMDIREQLLISRLNLYFNYLELKMK